MRISRRGFLRAARNLLVGGSLSVLGVYEYIQVQMQWFKLNKLRLPVAGLPEAFDGLKLVHLSDLHFGPWITTERFGDVVQKANRQEPDLILITGDFIDHETPASEIPAFIALLEELEADLGVYAVLGNHDYWRDADLAREMLDQSGIANLSNRIETLKRDGDVLHLCGLDDYLEGRQDLDAVLQALPDQGCALLLVHEPDYADISSATRRFALQLSGHSHGGQVYLPFYGPPIVPQYAEKYPRGLYQVNGMTLYTNAGIGMVRPYVRFNCRPELAVLTLEQDIVR